MKNIEKKRLLLFTQQLRILCEAKRTGVQQVDVTNKHGTTFKLWYDFDNYRFTSDPNPNPSPNYSSMYSAFDTITKNMLSENQKESLKLYYGIQVDPIIIDPNVTESLKQAADEYNDSLKDKTFRKKFTKNFNKGYSAVQEAIKNAPSFEEVKSSITDFGENFSSSINKAFEGIKDIPKNISEGIDVAKLSIEATKKAIHSDAFQMALGIAGGMISAEGLTDKMLDASAYGLTALTAFAFTKDKEEAKKIADKIAEIQIPTKISVTKKSDKNKASLSLEVRKTDATILTGAFAITASAFAFSFAQKYQESAVNQANQKFVDFQKEHQEKIKAITSNKRLSPEQQAKLIKEANDKLALMTQKKNDDLSKVKTGFSVEGKKALDESINEYNETLDRWKKARKRDITTNQANRTELDVSYDLFQKASSQYKKVSMDVYSGKYDVKI